MAACALATIALLVARSAGQGSGVLLFAQTAGLYVALGSLQRCPRWTEAVSRHAFFIYLTHFVLLALAYATLPAAHVSSALAYATSPAAHASSVLAYATSPAVHVSSALAWLLPLALSAAVIALESAAASLLCRLAPPLKSLLQ